MKFYNFFYCAVNIIKVYNLIIFILIVTGCLAQRYSDELKTEIPEIDAIVGTGSYQQIDEIIANLEKENHIVSLDDIDFAYNEDLPRYVSTPDYMAYLKIGEGCDHFIPSICASSSINSGSISFPYKSHPYFVVSCAITTNSLTPLAAKSLASYTRCYIKNYYNSRIPR